MVKNQADPGLPLGTLLTTLLDLVLDLANAKGSIMLVPTHHDWHCQMPLPSPWHMPARIMAQNQDYQRTQWQALSCSIASAK